MNLVRLFIYYFPVELNHAQYVKSYDYAGIFILHRVIPLRPKDAPKK